jgi:AraC-like DNA-binding protein
VGAGWRPLFGNFRELGFSFEWHEFTCSHDLDWARSFHPCSIELCLNLAGIGRLGGPVITELPANSLAFYFQGEPPLIAARCRGEKHRFITVEFAPPFLREHFGSQTEHLHPLVRSAVTGKTNASAVSAPERLSSTHQQLVESLRFCPVFKPAQETWFRCKALELAAHLFFCPPSGELFCTRAQRAARERVERVRLILKENMREPPSLEELGKLVGCSPFYLSRLFSEEAGMTIQQHLRQMRLEYAARLLSEGRCNVTEAALEVGYNSLSHFSTAFHTMFGCCPGLYPLKTMTQAAAAAPQASVKE